MVKQIGNLVGVTTDTSRQRAIGIFDLIDVIRARRVDEWPELYVNATGGTESTPGDGYKYHTFTSPGTFEVLTAGRIQYLVVGGGGNGSQTQPNQGANGARGGGVRTGEYEFSNQNYPITVGSAGGSSSVGSPVIIFASQGPQAANPSPDGISPTVQQAYSPGTPTSGRGAGGAGAGGNGSPPNGTIGGPGGAALTIPEFNISVSGGGGGGGVNPNTPGNPGGGSYGRGGYGGGSNAATPFPGGPGQPGVVMFRYLLP